MLLKQVLSLDAKKLARRLDRLLETGKGSIREELRKFAETNGVDLGVAAVQQTSL